MSAFYEFESQRQQSTFKHNPVSLALVLINSATFYASWKYKLNKRSKNISQDHCDGPRKEYR